MQIPYLWLPSKNLARPSMQKDQHQTKARFQEYVQSLPIGYETRMKTTKLQHIRPSYRSGSGPKLQHLRFETETLIKSKERPKEFIFAQQQTKAGNCQGGRIRQKDYSNQQRMTSFQEQKSQKYIYQKKRSKVQVQLDQKYGLSNIKNKFQSATQCSQQKLQITFNIDSTEPEQTSKEKIASTPIINSQQYCEQMYSKARINKTALEIWKRRKMEREIKEKQVQYRSLIRSLSRSLQKQKKIIQNKMKEVINDIFQLRKTIKHG